MHKSQQKIGRILRRGMLITCILAVILGWQAGLQTSEAQGTRPYVAVYEINPSTHAIQQISIHAPGSSVSSFTIPGGQYITPNGRYAMAMPVLGSYSVLDLQTNTTLNSWPSSPGTMIPNSMAVSPNATYAGIASVSTVDNSWSVTLFNLTTNLQVSFGDHIDPSTGHGSSAFIPLQPKIEGWTGDETALIVSTAVPNSDSPFRNYYKVAMSSLIFGPPAPAIPVPATVQLAPASQINKLVFSPDSTKAAYGYGDPANPPTHYVPAAAGPGSPLPPNTLGILDLNVGTTQIVAHAGPGQGLSAPAWSPDGLQVLFAAGDFSDSYFVGNPRIFSYSFPTNAVSTGGALTTDPPHHGISDMSVCDSTIFLRNITTAPDGTLNFGTIVSAPVGALLTQSPIYGTPENVLGPCVPMIGTVAATAVPSGPTATIVPSATLVIPPAVPIVYTCNLPPRLVPGGQGIVTPGNPNNLRVSPIAGSTLISQIPPNGIFAVLGGPVCDTTSGYNFWQVNYGGKIGYTAEGKDGIYFVSPYVPPAATAIPTATVTPTATATIALPPPVAMSPTDCIGYNPQTLSVLNKGAIGYILTDGSSSLVLLDNASDANLAKSVFQLNTQQCFIGRGNHRAQRKNYIMTYLQGTSGISTVIGGQDCIGYNPADLKLIQNADGSVTLATSSSLMQTLDNMADGNLALFIAKKYTKQCFIGRNNARPNRIDYIVEYFR